MTEPLKKPRQSRIHLVKPAEPDLEAMARVIAEAASQQAPLISRAVSLRNRQQTEANALTGERMDFEDRKKLLTSQYNAVLHALDTHIRDIDAALAIINDGIGGTAGVAALDASVAKSAD